MIAISGWGVLNEAAPCGETKESNMTLNILLTGLIFFVLFFWIVQVVERNDVSDRVAAVIIGGYFISAATVVVAALVLVWTR